uniref:Uncharacterized protein n=1 Tax=Arundo donax TaxID=35708 RepID=A0A0A9CCK4_ARUDO
MRLPSPRANFRERIGLISAIARFSDDWDTEQRFVNFGAMFACCDMVVILKLLWA